MNLTPKNVKQYEPELLKYASNSECAQDRRGALVVRDGVKLGGGWNASPLGKCTPDVCHRRCPVPGVVMTPPLMHTRSCSRQVEHAEAMAIRHAVIRAVSLDSRVDSDTFDDELAGGEYKPLRNCDLIHLNTEPFLADVMDEVTPRRLAKSSRQRGCASCAVQAMNFGIARVWLLHDTGWTCYSMDDYYEMAVIA